MGYRAAVVLLGLILILPYAALFSQLSLGDLQSYNWYQLIQVTCSSFLQAFASSIGALIGGLLFLPFFLWSQARLPRGWHRFIESLGFLPAFLPPLVMVFGLLHFKADARGWIWIVCLYIMMNSGFVGVNLSHAARRVWAPYVEMSLLLGSDTWFFLRKVGFRLILPALVSNGIVVFAWCLCGFTIPLLLGGASATTFEVLVYQQIVMQGNWSSAVVTGVFYLSFVSLLSFVFSPQHKHDLSAERRPWRGAFLTSCSTGPLLILPLLLIFEAMRADLPGAVGEMTRNPDFRAAIWSSIQGSVLVLACAIALTIGLQVLAIISMPIGIFQRLLQSYFAPSAMLLGMGILLVLPDSIDPHVRMGFGIALLYFPFTYKLYIDHALQALRSQIESAILLGARPERILRQIVGPQMTTPLAMSLGLLCVWALGDYSISALLADGTQTLSTLAFSLLSSYRLYLSSIVLVLVLVLGFAGFYVLRLVGDVARS